MKPGTCTLLADDFAEDKRWGYPKWKVALGKLTGKGKKGD